MSVKILLRHLGLELLALVVVLGVGAFFGLGRLLAEPTPKSGYEVLDADLEPFRADFNAASDHVRAVLLVGPT